MKLIVNHRGQQSLVVSKPDAAILEKAKGLLGLAAAFYAFPDEAKRLMLTLIDSTVALARKDSTDDQAGLLEAGEDDPPAVAD